jgi:hypothetical protein
VHIPKFRIGVRKVLANASTPDFSGTSDIILGYALNITKPKKSSKKPREIRGACAFSKGAAIVL